MWLARIGRLWTVKRKKFSIGQKLTALLLLFLYFSGLYQYITVIPYRWFYKHPGSPVPTKELLKQYENGAFKEEPFNTFKYPIIHSPEAKCNEKLNILVIVKSSVNNFEQRNAIRGTWGREDRFPGRKIGTIFNLGTSKDTQSRIDNESSRYDDILQGDFLDTYFNNTIKTMMGLHWSSKYCDKGHFFVMVDDDYYVSMKHLIQFTENPLKFNSKSKIREFHPLSDDLYAGYVYERSCPIRWYFNKWYISLLEYPYSQWPPYITGGICVLSRASLVKLYVTSLFTNIFRFDDVFLGIVAKKAAISLLDIGEYNCYENCVELNYEKIMSVHGFSSPTELINFWNIQYRIGNA